MVADKTTIIQRLKFIRIKATIEHYKHDKQKPYSIKDIYYVFKAPAWKNMKQFKREGKQPDLYNKKHRRGAKDIIWTIFHRNKIRFSTIPKLMFYGQFTNIYLLSKIECFSLPK